MRERESASELANDSPRPMDHDRLRSPDRSDRARREARAALSAQTGGREAALAEISRKRFEGGDVPRADLVEARAASAKAKADSDADAIQVAAASSALAALLAWPPEEPLHAEGGLPKIPDPPPLAALRDKAHDHPEVRAARS